ncbi:MAG: phosphate/phosphite/phosphonate ABC transporter substrate-binding protein [Proteobacteria bacterium]|nr:phosphate/phosphite/phosphonate ABC transporter substrate-binding protein [Pseudomonadota bacterium]
MRSFRRHLPALLLVLGGTIAVVIVVRVATDIGGKLTTENRGVNSTIIRINAEMKAGEEKTKKADLPRLRIAIAPVISPEKTYVSYREFVNYLAQAVGRKGELLIRSTYGEVNELLRDKRCDAALICTLAYLRGKKEFDLKLMAAPVIKGNLHYHSYFLVPESSGSKSLLDLKGKLFASADIMSTSGWLYPAVWLKKEGKDPLNFFKKHIISGSHDRSIQSVANSEVDGAAVDSLVYDQMPEETKKKVRIIHTSPPFGMPPVVVPSGLDEQLKERLLNALLQAHKSLEGKAILSALEMDRFEVVKSDLYDSIQELENQWQERQ